MTELDYTRWTVLGLFGLMLLMSWLGARNERALETQRDAARAETDRLYTDAARTMDMLLAERSELVMYLDGLTNALRHSLNGDRDTAWACVTELCSEASS